MNGNEGVRSPHFFFGHQHGIDNFTKLNNNMVISLCCGGVNPTMEFEKISDTLKALADPTRLKMISLLRNRDCCVCEFVPVFNISQPAISKHVGRLKAAGIVRETRRGQWVFYSLNEKRIEEIGFALNHLPDLSERLNELKERGLLVTCE
jgi:ArsR family transcriptional regulator